MITTPNNGSFINNLSLAESQSNALPSWMSFNSSTAEITITDPDTVSSDLYTITNTFTSVFGSSFTLTNDLNITVIEVTVPNNTVPNNTVPNNTVSNNTNSNSEDDDYCFDTSSEIVCGIIITIIAVVVIVPVIIIGVIIYCRWSKARENSHRACVQGNDNQENIQHHSIQQQDHQPMQAQDVALETEARAINEVYQTPDHQL